MINEWRSYAFSCVTPITVWVVSKNESNSLSENKMVSTLIWRCQFTVRCSVKHFMAYYLAILPLPM